MKVVIRTARHTLTKRQLSIIEALGFTENWMLGKHGQLESLELHSSNERKMVTEELDEKNIRWEVILG